ncbi:MAG: hypothetical protein ABJP66_06275 [Hyphomicrobiales bacterium]
MFKKILAMAILMLGVSPLFPAMAQSQENQVEHVEFGIGLDGRLEPKSTPIGDLMKGSNGSHNNESGWIPSSNTANPYSALQWDGVNKILEDQDIYLTKSSEGAVEALTTFPRGVAPPADFLTKLPTGAAVEKVAWNGMFDFLIPSEEQVRQGYTEVVNRTISIICSANPRPKEISPSFSIEVGAGVSGTFQLTSTFETADICAGTPANP